MIGSYFLAQEVRVKRPRRKATTAPSAAGANGAATGQSEDAAEAEPVSR